MEMTWDECYKQYNNLCWKLVNTYKTFKLEYLDSNAKKRQHEIHLDINHVDNEGNRFEEILVDKNEFG